MTDPVGTRELRGTVAAGWHTGCVLAMLAAFSVISALLRLGSTTPRLGHLSAYALLTAFEWATLAVSVWGSNVAFVRHVQRVVEAPRALLVDIPLALLLAGISFLVGPLMTRVLGPSGWVSVEGLRPQTGLEVGVWMMLALSAGVCEEVVFRGYLLQQFSAWTGRTSIGVVAQATVFGLVHGYQGGKNMVLIFVIGCLYGAVAVLRRGLRANMIAHAVVDILSGV